MRRLAAYCGVVLLGVSGAAAQPPAEGVPLAEVREAESPVLTVRQERRDPFRPFTLDLRPKTVSEPFTPLQRYELAQLRVAAVLLDINPPRAMLEDNSGMGFIVTPGTPIGRRRGVVTAIQPGKVVVEERALDFYGHEQVNRVVLEMPAEKEPQGASQE